MLECSKESRERKLRRNGRREGWKAREKSYEGIESWEVSWGRKQGGGNIGKGHFQSIPKIMSQNFPWTKLFVSSKF